jgi:hypothetical protein
VVIALVWLRVGQKKRCLIEIIGITSRLKILLLLKYGLLVISGLLNTFQNIVLGFV